MAAGCKGLVVSERRRDLFEGRLEMGEREVLLFHLRRLLPDRNPDARRIHRGRQRGLDRGRRRADAGW